MTRFVRAGVAMGFVLALLVAAVVRASDAPTGAPGFDPQSNRFTVAVIPDTQYLFDNEAGDSEPVTAALKWMVDNRADQNIAFAAGLGDVTQDGLENEVARADDAFKILDRAKLPYSVLAGNHDIPGSNDNRPATPYSKYFGPARYANDPTFVGAYGANGYDTAHKFTAAGREWLVLSMDWVSSDQGIAWAQSILDANKKVPTILTTHDLLGGANSSGVSSLSGNGNNLWTKLVKKNDQIILGIGGHNWPVGRTTMTNDFGHTVYLNLADYQDMYYGGAGIIRTYAFDIDRNTIDVSTFSPWVQNQPESDRNAYEREMLEKTGPESRFNLSVDFKALAQRLDPKPAPTEVATDALRVPGTVALWRPSGTGNVTKLDDLSGHGNDLTPATLTGSTGEQAQVSVQDDHGDTQPSAKSLKFTSNKSQHRGTYLRTADNAPLNANEFKSGYTIEAYIKVPAGCCSGHDWMGILGQQGTGADIGRTQSDPGEGTIEFALSGGNELQWAVWPTNRGDITTAWGHGMASDRWTHVAVTNDGRYTDLYIDGALMGRNPMVPAIGLGNSGKYWMLGAIDYDNVVEQTFNGLIGDVRIVDHALPASQFMNAARAPKPAATPTRVDLSGKTVEVTVDGTATNARAEIIEGHTGERYKLSSVAVSSGKATFALSDVQYAGVGDGARVEITLDNGPLTTLHLRAGDKQFQPTLQTPVDANTGGTVPAVLALTLGNAASFGAFTPGVAKEYSATTVANVVSTAADAMLTVADPSTNHAGYLVNGTFALAAPIQGLGTIKAYSGPVSNDAVPVTFKQAVGANEALRTGAYSKTLTFTLSTTTP
jgi:hypothetical protein